MGKHVRLSAEEEANLEEGGGVKKDTQKERDRFTVQFAEFVSEQTLRSVGDLLSPENKTEEVLKHDRDEVSLQFSRFFWMLRVDVWVLKWQFMSIFLSVIFQVKNGENKGKVSRKPMASYANKVKSHIKTAIIME